MKRIIFVILVFFALTLTACGGGSSTQATTPDQVIEAFQAAGLEAVNPRTMTKEDYGAAPMLAIKGVHFLIPSLCEDCGGRVMSFASQKDLEIMKAYYDELGKSSALFFSWTFANGNILVQINGDLPEDQAMQYEQTLIGIGQ